MHNRPCTCARIRWSIRRSVIGRRAKVMGDTWKDVPLLGLCWVVAVQRADWHRIGRICGNIACRAVSAQHAAEKESMVRKVCARFRAMKLQVDVCASIDIKSAKDSDKWCVQMCPIWQVQFGTATAHVSLYFSPVATFFRIDNLGILANNQD